ncbi:tetratricopeptide repeat protein [Magnetococcales bacterium HHB-1]
MFSLIFPLYADEKEAQDKLLKEAYHRSFHYEKMQDYTNAIKSLMPVYEDYPNYYTLNLRLGWLNYLAGQYANALRHYRVASTVLPSAIDSKQGLAMTLLVQEKFKEAEQVCYEILTQDHYNYYGNLYLVTALMAQDKTSIALNVVRRVLVHHPTDIKFLEKLALIYLKEQKEAEARVIFKDLSVLDPTNLVAARFFKKKMEQLEKD